MSISNIFTWLKGIFGKQDSISRDIEFLVGKSMPIIAEIEAIKARYKEAETLIDKHGILVDYVKAKDSYSISIANQLIYCPAAALWTELAVIGLKAIYPQATGYYLRCAITLAYAYFAANREKDQSGSEAAK